LNAGKARVRSANSVLAVATVSHMMQHIFLGTSILFPLIVSELALNYTEFGIAIAVSSLIGGLFQTVFSMLSRRVARHVLLGLGNILLSSGTFLTGVSHNFFHFLSARTVANVGTAPQHPMGTSIVSERFDRESVGKAIGIHYGLAYVGNIIGPLFATFLVVYVGWRGILFIFSIPAFIVGFTVILYLKEDRRRDSSGRAGTTSSLKSDIIALAETKSVIPIIVTQALLSGGTDLGIITTYTPLFLADAMKLDIYQRGIFYTIGLVGGVVGPVLLGRYAGKTGYLRTATFSSFIALVLVYLLSLYDSANPVLALHLFFLGLASFALPTLLQSHLVRITQEYRRDLVVGIFFTVGYGFSSLWAAAIGYIIDVYSSFAPAFILMGTLGLAASIILIDQNRKLG
jgi:FSR family fosmidomycin resistance protein-like MFS transporter